MKTVFAKVLSALALAGIIIVSVSAPAQAYWDRGYGYGGGWYHPYWHAGYYYAPYTPIYVPPVPTYLSAPVPVVYATPTYPVVYPVPPVGVSVNVR